MSIQAIVAARTHAQKDGCDCCGRYTRCALIWIDQLGIDVRRALRICSGCCRAAWNAAKTTAAERRRAS